MITSIRAKLAPGAVERDSKGTPHLALNAVYEGSNELQGISENAIFGNASPSGFLEVIGGELPIDKFSQDEEYYVDIWPAGETRTGYLVQFPLRKTYQNGPHPKNPNYATQFRFAATAVVYANFSISIMNPVAIGFLDDKEHFVMGVKLARGRRPDAEIEVRQRLLDQFIEDAKGHQYWSAPENKAVYDRQVNMLTRKLAIAKGEITD